MGVGFALKTSSRRGNGFQFGFGDLRHSYVNSLEEPKSFSFDERGCYALSAAAVCKIGASCLSGRS